MNIERLAKHLKEFTRDEIEMIAECDCKTELEHLLNSNKIVFEQGYYYYQEVKNYDYEIFVESKRNRKNYKIKSAVKYFMENHVKQYCKISTYKNYDAIFRLNILPFFEEKYLKDISMEDIKSFYENCKIRNLSPKRFKNVLALLNQLIKYYQTLGVINKTCVFQVRRLNEKNEFSINRIIF